jgi:uncharacterized protein (DUF2345 family)
MIGDSAGATDYDGQIIQAEGNGVDDNTGIMTIQSGGLAINALSAGIQMASTSSTLIQSGTDMDLTCGGDLTVDTTGHHYITSALATTLTATTENLNLVTSSATGDINLTSGRSMIVTTNTTGGISRFESNKDQDIMRINNTVYDSKFLIGSTTTGFRQTVNNNSYAKLQALGNSQLNLSTANASMSLTATGTASSITLTSGLDVAVVAGDDFTVTTTGGITMGSGVKINMTANTDVDIKTTTGSITSDAKTTHSIISGTAMSLTSGTSMNLTSGTTLGLTASTSMSLSAPTVTINSGSAFNLIPAGTIIMTVSATVPNGYFYCNGDNYNTTSWSRLFAVIGYTFGGSGIAFSVPNFQGAFLRGIGSQTVSAVSHSGAALGTPQADQVLNATYGTQEGYFSVGGTGKECVARSRIDGDPLETSSNIAQFDRQGDENRPMNYSVYYYIRF